MRSLKAMARSLEPAAHTAGRTGLPASLKAGVERLSGVSLDDVRVHYGSPRPAKMEAHAFAQGASIHLATGQERHLPHEAWHVVQQKQGRVPATGRIAGAPLNNDPTLEREAEAMGARAVSLAASLGETSTRVLPAAAEGPVQRVAIRRGRDNRWVAALRGGMNSDTVFGKARAALLSEIADDALKADIEQGWRELDAHPWRFVMGSTVQTQGPAWMGDPKAAPGPCPTLWAGMPVQPRPADSAPVPLTELQYSVMMRGSSVKRSGEHYNPYNRFGASDRSSFVPDGLSPEGRSALDQHLRAKDKTYVPPTEAAGWSKEVHPTGHPKTMTTKEGKVLHLHPSAYGGHYFSTPPADERVARKGALSTAPAQLKTASLPSSGLQVKIDAETIKAWAGMRPLSASQKVVMGCSAAQVAAAAGLDDQDWEWLHLVAHSLGGLPGKGPQTPENLVAGTAEANTAMMMIEGVLEDAVINGGARAELFVHYSMHDHALRIGGVIRYDVRLTYPDSRAPSVHAWTIDCLSRNQPTIAMNRHIRYHERVADGRLGKAGEGKHPSGRQSRTVVVNDPISVRIASEIERAGSDRAMLIDTAVSFGRTMPGDIDAVMDALRALPDDNLRTALVRNFIIYHPDPALLEALSSALARSSAGVVAMVAKEIAKSLTFLGGLPASSSSSSSHRSETSRSGNCLFEAVNILLGNDAELDVTLREMCTDYFVEHPGLAEEAGLNADDVVATLSTSGAWAGAAGDLSPAVLASVIGRNLRIVTEQGTVVVQSAEPVQGPELLLYLADGHYTRDPAIDAHRAPSGSRTLSLDAALARARNGNADMTSSSSDQNAMLD